MKNVLLKNVPETEWITFKTEAINHEMNLGDFLGYLVREHKKMHNENRWKKILSYRSGRSEEEIKKHKEFITKNRKEFSLER